MFNGLSRHLGRSRGLLMLRIGAPRGRNPPPLGNFGVVGRRFLPPAAKARYPTDTPRLLTRHTQPADSCFYGHTHPTDTLCGRLQENGILTPWGKLSNGGGQLTHIGYGGVTHREGFVCSMMV